MSAADPIQIAQSLIQCESVTPEDGGAQVDLAQRLEALGFEVHRLRFSAPGTPDIENLYARIGDQSPNFCFAGHTDVVPTGDPAAWTHPPFAGTIDGDTLFGRGAVDMKGAIACFVAAAAQHLAAHNGRPAHGSMSLLITGDEEGAAINGTVKVLEWLEQRGEQIDYCLVGEPTNPEQLGDEIKIGRRGSLSGRLVVHGRQGHVAYPHLADNPVPKLARMIDALSRAELDDGTEHFARSNLEFCVLESTSTATNVIPATAAAEFNIRYNTHWKRDRLEAWVRSQCEAIATENGTAFELSFSGSGDAFLTEQGSFVACVQKAVAAVTGRTPELTTSGGTSDARFIQAYCPVVEFGLVNRTIHAVDERTPINDLASLTAIYRRLLDDGMAESA